ncbi:MAG: hypothetical protein HRT92_04200 [Piscirickettsiaceae bacterium]|nr:hypothetical protein [Piscirickettsiaceae bacterium]
MSILVLQITIKQWDKSQRSQKHIEQRAKIANHYPLVFPPTFYAFDTQCVIDQHGDDLLGNRLRYSQPDDDTIQFDQFQIGLSNKILEYIGSADSDIAPRTIGSLDNRWVQCQYDWRYSVYHGGFYYWLYEQVTVNAIYLNTLNENSFMNGAPDQRVLLT